MTRYSLLLMAWLTVLSLALPAQPQTPQNKAKAANKAQEIRPPDDAARAAIEARTAKLHEALARLRGQKLSDDRIAEVEIYAKAAEWVTRHNEFFGDTAKWTVEVLDHGLAPGRAGGAWRSALAVRRGTSVVRAYRSHVDGSVQPYAVTYRPTTARTRARPGGSTSCCTAGTRR